MSQSILHQMFGKIVSITIGTMIVSASLVAALFFYFYGGNSIFSRDLFIAMLMAVIVPIFIAPPLLYIFLKQAKRLEVANKKLAQILRFDSLTKLLTRRAFFTETQEVIRDISSSSSVSTAVMFIDIDHFKQVNDTFGHEMGDKVLAKLGQVLKQQIPSQAICGRLGGEEFAIFLPDVKANTTSTISRNISKVFKAQARVIDGKPIAATLSIGIFISHRNHDIDTMLNKADDMLYRAKHQGRDQVHTIDSNQLAA